MCFYFILMYISYCIMYYCIIIVFYSSIPYYFKYIYIENSKEYSDKKHHPNINEFLVIAVSC